MALGLLKSGQVMTWLVVVVVLVVFSYRSLGNIQCHGFYRFFAFSSVALVVIANVPYWHDNLFAPYQLISWVLLSVSLLFVFNGLFLLRVKGGTRDASIHQENFHFENTGILIQNGVYGLIRHPMYSALLLCAWGAWFKQLNWIGLVACLTTTGSIWITAKKEEIENIEYFGQAYETYKQKTKYFIPFVW